MKIGVLGAGQLGRMLALAGYNLDLDFVLLDPAADACAAPLGEHLHADYADQAALARLCDAVDVVTYEFENVPAASAEFVARRKPLFPGTRALTVSQDRLSEKKLFTRLKIAVPPYAPVSTRAELDAALKKIGLPSVLKTRCLGYDGKGQAVLRTVADVDAAWERLGRQPLLLEAFVPFQREISCIGARGRDGQVAFYPVAQNVHRDGILRTSIPRKRDPLQRAAEKATRAVMEELGYVGVLAFEFFVASGKLLGNEIAPRVHNSGHWTIDGAQCSQFENHLRAVAGLPLGSTALRGHAAMVNFIGEMPDLAKLAKLEGLHVHLYGKTPKPGRKIGHANLTADSAAGLKARLKRLESLL
ncbi:MAG TPA: 5-(carboxyamino)imidazole ribonucleotide synthase [Verrucomicrobiae bacterium]|nr:5-(carboxyamino)imidazole ribonucleotide synthase [Verrucomicrobiae bacterium]